MKYLENNLFLSQNLDPEAVHLKYLWPDQLPRNDFSSDYPEILRIWHWKWRVLILLQRK